MSAYAKLQEARIRLQGMKLKKSGKNKFAGYDYFELGDFLPAINQIFHELKLCATVTFHAEEASLMIVDTEAELGTLDAAVTIACPMADAALKGMTPVQNLGATMTYIRRYLYVTALEIVEHDALDAAEPVKAGVIKPTDGAFDSIPTDAQKLVSKAVKNIREYWAKGDEWGAFENYDILEGDNRTAAYELLSQWPEIRNRLKEMKMQANPLNA